MSLAAIARDGDFFPCPIAPRHKCGSQIPDMIMESGVTLSDTIRKRTAVIFILSSLGAKCGSQRQLWRACEVRAAPETGDRRERKNERERERERGNESSRSLSLLICSLLSFLRCRTIPISSILLFFFFYPPVRLLTQSNFFPISFQMPVEG